MPRVKQNISPTEQKNREILGIIEYHNRRLGIDSREDLAERFQMEIWTLYRRMRHPEQFTVSELRIISKVQGWNDQQKAAIF